MFIRTHDINTFHYSYWTQNTYTMSGINGYEAVLLEEYDSGFPYHYKMDLYAYAPFDLYGFKGHDYSVADYNIWRALYEASLKLLQHYINIDAPTIWMEYITDVTTSIAEKFGHPLECYVTSDDIKYFSDIVKDRFEISSDDSSSEEEFSDEEIDEVVKYRSEEIEIDESKNEEPDEYYINLGLEIPRRGNGAQLFDVEENSVVGVGKKRRVLVIYIDEDENPTKKRKY